MITLRFEGSVAKSVDFLQRLRPNFTAAIVVQADGCSTLADAVVLTDAAPTQDTPAAAPVAPVETPADNVVPLSVKDGAPAEEELDVNGIPYDDRIHSAGKTKNVDGTWRLKRGVSKDIVDKIEAEYKGAADVSDLPEAEAPVRNTVASVPPAAPVAPVAPVAPAAPVVPVAAAAPTEGAPTASQAVDAASKYPSVVSLLSAAKAVGVYSDAEAQAFLSERGLASMALLAVNPSVMDEFYNILVSKLG